MRVVVAVGQRAPLTDSVLPRLSSSGGGKKKKRKHDHVNAFAVFALIRS